MQTPGRTLGSTVLIRMRLFATSSVLCYARFDFGTAVPVEEEEKNILAEAILAVWRGRHSCAAEEWNYIIYCS